MFVTRQLKSLSKLASLNLRQCSFPPSCTSKNLSLTSSPPVQKNDGVDVGDPDQVDGIEQILALEKYNSLYINLNRQTPSMENVGQQQEMFNGIETDLDNVDEIDSYEQLFLNSYNEHYKNSKMKQADEKGRASSEHTTLVEGRLHVGDTGAQLLEGGRVLEQAELTAGLIAKRSGDLVADHYPRSSSRLVIKVAVDHQAAEVLVTVGLSDKKEGTDDDCRTEAYTACAVALANVYHAVKDVIPHGSISSVEILDG